MKFPQSTLEEITESERQMLLTAKERFGSHYVNARASSVFLSRCIAAVNRDRMIFGRFFALAKKHHMLAIMSAVRLHKVQAMMNLRQVLEAGAAAAYGIANTDGSHFYNVDQDNIITTPTNLAAKRYRWLEQNFKVGSDAIKAKKALINEAQSHANVVSSERVFRIADTGDLINAPFFDIEDDHFVKIDLWLAASIALDLMNLFYGVNVGRNVIEFIPNFPAFLGQLQSDTETVRAEMMTTARYQAAMARAAAHKISE
jgi:hypothetical protein